MALRIVFPAFKQIADPGFVRIDADRRIHAAPADHETLEIAHPLQFADKRCGIGIHRAQRFHLRNLRVGAVEVALLQCSEPAGQFRLQQRFARKSPFARRQQVFQLALCRAAQVECDRGHRDQRHAGGSPPRRAPHGRSVVARERARQLRCEHAPATLHTARLAVAFRFVGGGLRSQVDFVFALPRLVDAENIEERVRGADKRGLVGIDGIFQRRRRNHLGHGRLDFGVVLQVYPVDEVIAAECNDVAVMQRVRAFVQAFSANERAVRAAQILDMGLAAFQENVRVAPRDVVDLMRIAILVAREYLVGLADEKRERVHVDRLQTEVVALRYEHDAERQRRARGGHDARARLDADAVRQLAAKTQFVAGAHAGGRLPDADAVQRRAVLAVEIGDIDGAMFGENAGVPARQPGEQFARIVRERGFAASDREQVVDDADRPQRRMRHRREHDIEGRVECRPHLSNRSFAGGHCLHH